MRLAGMGCLGSGPAALAGCRPPVRVRQGNGSGCASRDTQKAEPWVFPGSLALIAVVEGRFGGEGGIRTLVPGFPDHPISSRRRYGHFGTSPDFCFNTAETPHSASLHNILAERAGFEPAVHLCGHTHDFQSCSFGHSDISPRLFNCRIGSYPLFLKKSTQNFSAFFL